MYISLSFRFLILIIMQTILVCFKTWDLVELPWYIIFAPTYMVLILCVVLVVIELGLKVFRKLYRRSYKK